ncbi:CAP domain-containing protein [Acuticoccus mangrovi]|uniref:CAP domain-containing protein n=1 Tax=Acuticoccus mangrovi TaxID=2796142 RepID=A0A934IUD8_9HYPH|nr:CAP domain-containing protein [Acuticoccus mangrovi]MBJ3778342.1 CAP domain-containing protein [Acuticoccus mangrovi]
MLRRTLLLLALCLPVAGCGLLGIGGDSPQATVPNVPRERSVDPARAASLINAHRAAHGRGALTVDATLDRVAADTARELARRNKLKTEMHTASGLAKRLDAAGYPAVRAAENLGAGYPTLVMAVDGWEGSRQHNQNLLNPEMTRMGIGLALTDQGQFKSYWVLILAKPDERAQ